MWKMQKLCTERMSERRRETTASKQAGMEGGARKSAWPVCERFSLAEDGSSAAVWQDEAGREEEPCVRQTARCSFGTRASSWGADAASEGVLGFAPQSPLEMDPGETPPLGTSPL